MLRETDCTCSDIRHVYTDTKRIYTCVCINEEDSGCRLMYTKEVAYSGSRSVNGRINWNASIFSQDQR